MKLSVRFFLDGREFAARLWWYAPRVGDDVWLGAGEQREMYRVTQVVWGDDDETFWAHEGQVQAVNVVIVPSERAEA